MAARKRGTASAAARSNRFTANVNTLYRRAWRRLVAASTATAAGDRPGAVRELAALHETLGRFLTHP